VVTWDWQVGGHKGVRYGFTTDELETLQVFLAAAVEYLQEIAGEALRLKVTPDTAQSRLIIDGIIIQLQTLKRQAAFFGLMEMMMLIRQAMSMLEVMRCGNLQIEDVMTVAVLLDAKNILGEMIGELSEASAKLQGTEQLEIELACAQENDYLIDFIGQLLKNRTNAALVLVPGVLVSKLPLIIQTSPVKLEVQPERRAEGSHRDRNPVAGTISTPTTVSDEKIRELLTIIEELTTTNNAFSQLSRKLMMEHNLPDLSREARNVGQFVNRIATELEETVMSIGKVELGLIFLQFSHIVNNIGRLTGKDICLALEGGNITVDKIIVPQLSNLLLKIICTMAKLSIEPPVEREAVGKESQGHIWLRSYLSGKQIVIEVEDDGQSMKGVDADAEVLEIANMMVTMNEVYHQRDALPGKLEITSLSGKGSKIRITLPPSSMRCSGLLVEASGKFLIVPVDNVVEIVKVTYEQLVCKRGRQLLYHRGVVLGVVALAELLGMQQTEDCVQVVVVTNGQDKIGLLIHKLHNEQQIVLKSLPDYLKNSEYIGSAAVTSDGKVALVLNVSALIKKVGTSNC